LYPASFLPACGHPGTDSDAAFSFSRRSVSSASPCSPPSAPPPTRPPRAGRRPPCSLQR